jgi:hypothetical protein
MESKRRKKWDVKLPKHKTTSKEDKEKENKKELEELK